MAELKTKPTAESVSAFLEKIADEGRREDCLAVVDIMRDVIKEEPKMWGGSIVGFGRYHYKYQSGREGEWMITGFSPRKGDLTLYIMPGFEPFADLMKRLGKYKTGKSCLYVKKLADVNVKVLKELVTKSVDKMEPYRIFE
ncbi:MAG TPA: DUF1801 domain-containing protein [Pyrinomonadaceae bacterium]